MKSLVNHVTIALFGITIANSAENFNHMANVGQETLSEEFMDVDLEDLNEIESAIEKMNINAEEIIINDSNQSNMNLSRNVLYLLTPKSKSLIKSKPPIKPSKPSPRLRLKQLRHPTVKRILDFSEFALKGDNKQKH